MTKTLIITLFVAFYLFINIAMACYMTAEEMRTTFIDEQGKIGKVCSSITYALAWAIKGICALLHI